MRHKGGKSLYINEEVASGEVISYNKIIEVKNVDKVLYKVKCKWKNEVMNTVKRVEEMRGE